MDKIKSRSLFSFVQKQCGIILPILCEEFNHQITYKKNSSEFPFKAFRSENKLLTNPGLSWPSFEWLGPGPSWLNVSWVGRTTELKFSWAEFFIGLAYFYYCLIVFIIVKIAFIFIVDLMHTVPLFAWEYKWVLTNYQENLTKCWGGGEEWEGVNL